jgi:hypothetical protein
MRLVLVCQGCGVHYLPPDGLTYQDGTRASAVWCSPCQAAAAGRGEQEPADLAAVALLLAVRAMRAAAGQTRAAEQPRRMDIRPSRPARTNRGRSRPAGQRSRLG